MAAHQVPPSLGFSRQEHWSGLPFPSPMHESEKVKVKLLSRVQLFATPWTAAYQAPLSMGFSRQEYWSGLPLPPPANIILNGKKLKAFPLRPKKDKDARATFIQHSVGSATATGQGKEGHPNRKERSKTLTICRWHKQKTLS